MASDVAPDDMIVPLCLDEYEKLDGAVAAGWGGRSLDMLRHVQQHRDGVTLLFTGVRPFADAGPEWTGRFINARQIRVGRLSRDEVTPLLTEPIPDFGMTYAPGALDAALDETQGQPYLTQAVAFELVQHMNEERRTEATPDDVEAAVVQGLESGDPYFANVWSDAGSDGQSILRARLADEPLPDHPEAMRWLVENDVLHADAAFVVPMAERWMRERARRA
ncbi:hypothetical protein CMK11_03030 [Candidatus Poribacteria bacterium]|nr:hypothetical protein [Candidatus Poribacteria bacterium]